MGDAPPNFITQSSVGLETLANVAPGLVMKRWGGTKKIRHNGIMYVGDKDGHVSNPRAGPEVASKVVEKLKQQCDSWRKIIEIVHGKLAFHKTSWHLLAWEFDKKCSEGRRRR